MNSNLKRIIPYGKQNITEDDISAVIEVLKSDYLTQGPKIFEFETKFAEYIGSKYAVAVSNGTAALHLSSIALNIKKGTKVITSPLSFVATSNAVLYCGGEVEFCDINPETLLMDINQVRKKIESQPIGTYSGIIPVDFAGYPVQMDQFRALADEYGLWILEDSCHAPGGIFNDFIGKLQNCGNGNYADLAIFSFHPVKHIACGEGGMITTNNEKLYNMLLELRTHGITKDSDKFQNSIKLSGGSNKYPGWYMEMQDIGFNYRLSDIQASLGISQLKRADKSLLKRKQIAKKYFEAFNGKGFIKWQSGFISGHAYHLYILQVKNRLGLYEYLRKFKIYTQIHYFPIHLMPYYRSLGWKEGDMPNTENYYNNCISLPIFPTLTEVEHQFVIDKIISFYNE